MSTTRKWVEQGTAVLLMQSELSALAAGSLVRSTATFANTQGTSNTDGYTRALLLVQLTQNSYVANSSLDLWFVKQVNGTTEDGVAGTTPARPPDVSAGMQTSTTNTNVIYDIRVPPGTMYCLARNNQASGSQALATGSTANSVYIQFYTDQGV